MTLKAKSDVLPPFCLVVGGSSPWERRAGPGREGTPRGRSNGGCCRSHIRASPRQRGGKRVAAGAAFLTCDIGLRSQSAHLTGGEARSSDRTGYAVDVKAQTAGHLSRSNAAPEALSSFKCAASSGARNWPPPVRGGRCSIQSGGSGWRSS
jgi:hypothetical protein